MNEEALHAAFALLDEFLARGKVTPVWLVVGGGSALLVQQLGSRQTRDVMALREFEGDLISSYPLPDAVKNAAAKVAEELRLDVFWLNGSASLHGIDFRQLPVWFWQELATREYGHHLKISFIGRKGLILLKLGAALDRGQRRDIEDLICLNPSTVETEESLHWLLKTVHQAPNHPKIPSILQSINHAELISRFPYPPQ